MTNLQKYTIAQILWGSMWWMATGVFYFLERGLTIEQIYLMSSVFSVSMVIFEFPTGLIADKFSHKKTILFAGFLATFAYCWQLLALNFYVYSVIFIMLALASAMRSGSNLAVLHKISNNFSKDLARVQSLHFMWVVLTTLIGSWLYTIDIRFPYILTALTSLISTFIFSQIRVNSNAKGNDNDNLYILLLRSFKLIKRNQKLRAIILMSGAFSAFFFSYKWVLPTIFEIRNISVVHLSVVLSISTLALAIGSFLSGTRYYVRLKYSVTLLLVLILTLGFLKTFQTFIFVSLAIYFWRGFFANRMTVLVNKYAKDSVRASLLSFKNLVSRLFMSLYMLLVGKILGIWSPEVFSVITFIILSFFVIYFVWVMRMKNDY